MDPSCFQPNEVNTFRHVIERHEGHKTEIYRDTKGYPTFGIGHMIRPSDPEFGKPIGTKVTEQRVQAAFNSDMATASSDVFKMFPKAGSYPKEVKEVLVDMSFNMGRPTFEGFKKFKEAVQKEDWNKAADEMKASKWYGQVGNRSKNLEKRMREAAKNKNEHDKK